MARPTKTEAERRTITARVRLTASEAEQLTKLAENEGLTLSDFIRAKAIKAKPRQPKAQPHEVAAIRALGTLGNIRADVNQILKDRFSHVFVHPQRMEKSLTDIEEIANHIHNILSNGH